MCVRVCVLFCADVSVLDGVFRAIVLYACLSLCVCVYECLYVTGANSYVRGEVTPSCLSLGVCRGSYQLCK